MLLVILGLILVLKGADLFVDSASALAQRFNISELAIGLTIVAFGTSAPEFVVNVFASVQNHQEIVLANILGSNNFNVFIILGLAGIITPLSVHSNTAWKEIPFLLFTSFLLMFLLNNHLFFSEEKSLLNRLEGFILLLLFLLFLFYVYKQLKTDSSTAKLPIKEFPVFKIILFFILGLGGLVVGGKLVVQNAIKIATILQVSEKIIGLTIVSVGTSLPELATSIVAAAKKNNDIAVGNIIGSNIFNILLILGLSSIINPITYDLKFNTDLLILTGGTLFLFIAMYTGKRKKLDRWESILLFVFYMTYMVYLILV
ncbi:MAG TPA: calcium/sodium antiporter [Bacteroidales bacterium]|nr:calcium/sodium antiporter [Bacteroidales bacterium]